MALTHTQKPKGQDCGSEKFKTNIYGTLESDTQSALAENNFYKTSDHLLQKGKIP